jgi:hypothetical protein
MKIPIWIFWTNCQHQWISEKTCHHGVVDSSTLSSWPQGNQCPFQWWGKYEAMFLTVNFLAHQILSIVGLQIEI